MIFARRQTPDARRQTPDARRQTPDARRQTPDARSYSLMEPLEGRRLLSAEPIELTAAVTHSGDIEVTITRNENVAEGVTVDLATAGTAVAGVDYHELPDAVSFDDGQAVTTFLIYRVDDPDALTGEVTTLELTAAMQNALATTVIEFEQVPPANEPEEPAPDAEQDVTKTLPSNPNITISGKESDVDATIEAIEDAINNNPTVKEILEDIGEITINVVRDNPSVYMGAFDTETVDIGDWERSPERLRERSIVHELVEQHEKQVNGKGFHEAHGIAITAENELGVDRIVASESIVPNPHGGYTIIKSYLDNNGRVIKVSQIVDDAGVLTTTTITRDDGDGVVTTLPDLPTE